MFTKLTGKWRTNKKRASFKNLPGLLSQSVLLSDGVRLEHKKSSLGSGRFFTVPIVFRMASSTMTGGL
jgi:hypothetical protein